MERGLPASVFSKSNDKLRFRISSLLKMFRFSHVGEQPAIRFNDHQLQFHKFVIYA
jgi:hypothetical protein